MDSSLADRRAIDDLMTGWMRSDLAQWEAMRELFHPDGVIEITWFRGLFTDFVDASARMGDSALKTKHVITTPVVTFHGDRAVAETNAIVVAENGELKLGCQSHNRFYDRIEKRDGVWKIVDRRSIYDMGSFTFPCGIVDIDSDTAAKYPPEYAALAYLLDKSGFPVTGTFATKGSALEAELKVSGRRWLEDAR
ncbi:nuclear transport factor 2 family protein [Rhodococcus artemisiae]|uniref:Nuclear transport factor 2 family protein n=1 Tax=Rhodococcus artemisiae TaxID=714159 RepID=A0ABU7L933_9NOCA|nr:nuclear transport factor 2 family protein [Rhodococcus artemisiae]MEE2058052.1 nuclear transport factor 2 family protein [Rhodococcus artemisiae]